MRERGHPLLAGGSFLCRESTNLLLPSPLLSFPGYSHVNCDNHVDLPQLFNVAVLSSPWIAVAAAGGPCFSVVFWLVGLTLFASAHWKWIRPPELDFDSVGRIA